MLPLGWSLIGFAITMMHPLNDFSPPISTQELPIRAKNNNKRSL